MNLFTEKLPDTIKIGDEEFKIKTDFRIWIKFEKLFSDNEIPFYERFFKVVELCLDFKEKKKFPENPKLVLTELMKFYSCNRAKEKNGKQTAPLYDFCADSSYIYAAFLAEYGIDLTVCELHWWKFCALFSSLSDNCKICEIMRIRGTDLRGIKDAEQKKKIRMLKNVYRLQKNFEIDIAKELYKAF